MTVLGRLRRRLDRRYYRAMYALVRAALPTDVGPGPVDPATLRRILVLPNYKVGDLVVATPAIAYLRAAAPRARLDVLVSERNASLLDGDPRVDRVLLHDPQRDSWTAAVRRLRRERYDLVVDFVHPHHMREGLVTSLVAGRGGARVTAYRPAGFWGFFTHRPRVPGFEGRYMAERLLYAVQAAVGDARPRPDIARYPLALTVAPDAAERVAPFLDEHAPGAFVAFNAWASDPVRTLGVEQGAAIVAAIAGRHPDLAVVITPPPGAAPDAEAMAEGARRSLGSEAGRRVSVFPPSPRLPDLVALLHRAAVVFTPDTANVHLAAAVGRPVVALFTRLATERIAHWIPVGVPHRAVLCEPPRPLAEMAVGEAVEAFDALWAELGAGTARPAPAS